MTKQDKVIAALKKLYDLLIVDKGAYCILIRDLHEEVYYFVSKAGELRVGSSFANSYDITQLEDAIIAQAEAI